MSNLSRFILVFLGFLLISGLGLGVSYLFKTKNPQSDVVLDRSLTNNSETKDKTSFLSCENLETHPMVTNLNLTSNAQGTPVYEGKITGTLITFFYQEGDKYAIAKIKNVQKDQAEEFLTLKIGDVQFVGVDGNIITNLKLIVPGLNTEVEFSCIKNLKNQVFKYPIFRLFKI